MAGMMRKASYDAFSCSTGLRIRFIAILKLQLHLHWSGERDSNSRVRFGRPPYLPLYDHRLLALGGGVEPNPFEASKAPGLPLADPRTIQCWLPARDSNPHQHVQSVRS